MNEEMDALLDGATRDSNAIIDDLLAQVNQLKSELDKRKAIDMLTATARELKIPAEIIEHDLHMFTDHFALQDGQLVSANDPEKNAKDVLKEIQKQRVHWQPRSCGAGFEPMRATSTANNFAAEVERQSKEWFNR